MKNKGSYTNSCSQAVVILSLTTSYDPPLSFTPDFGYCHSISTDIFPLFRDSSGFSKLRSSFRQLKYQLFPSLHHRFMPFPASVTHVSHVLPDRWCSLWLSMNILSQGYLFMGCPPHTPFLSVASVTSTYDLDFLSHFFSGSWML